MKPYCTVDSSIRNIPIYGDRVTKNVCGPINTEVLNINEVQKIFDYEFLKSRPLQTILDEFCENKGCLPLKGRKGKYNEGFANQEGQLLMSCRAVRFTNFWILDSFKFSEQKLRFDSFRFFSTIKNHTTRFNSILYSNQKSRLRSNSTPIHYCKGSTQFSIYRSKSTTLELN